MTFLDRLRRAGEAYLGSPGAWSQGQALRAAMRAFVLGPADVTTTDQAFGYGPGEWQPEEYATYLATSNAVYACVRKRADALASLPIKLYRGQGDRKTEVTAGPLYDLLHRVNPHWTFQRLLAMHEYSLCIWGECYWWLERGQTGKAPPQEIWWGRSDRAYVYPDPVDYIKGYGYLPTEGGMPIAYLPSEVVAFRYPNPLNQFRGLSPLAAARLSADSANAAMKGNRAIFANGVQIGGLITPVNGTQLSEEQATHLKEDINRRFKGVDNFHRWGVLPFEVNAKEYGITPKDAEFLGLLKWTLEDIARAYNVPLDLVGGQRTYENLDAAMLALWTDAVIPDKTMVEQELSEQLLPMFPGQADSIELDTSAVQVLQKNEEKAWTIAQGKITTGAITINEWRKGEGLPPVAWGDEPKSAAPAVPAVPPVDKQAMPEQPPAPEPAPRRRSVDTWAYGGAEHRRVWERFVRSTEALEGKVTPVVQTLFRRQKDAILASLKGRSARAADNVAEEPFDMARWVKEFRQAIRVVLEEVVDEGGQQALTELGLEMAFDVNDPRVKRFLEQRAQRFANEVNQTTWDMLRASLAEAIDEGEGIPQMAERVSQVMKDRIDSTPETIARTEVIGAYNGGTLQAWKQSGVVTKKRWLAALDDRVRETHGENGAHNQVVGLDDDFRVGDGSGPCPGSIGLPEEDINCRCTMTAVVDVLDKG